MKFMSRSERSTSKSMRGIIRFNIFLLFSISALYSSISFLFSFIFSSSVDVNNSAPSKISSISSASFSTSIFSGIISKILLRESILAIRAEYLLNSPKGVRPFTFSMTLSEFSISKSWLMICDSTNFSNRLSGPTILTNCIFITGIAILPVDQIRQRIF